MTEAERMILSDAIKASFEAEKEIIRLKRNQRFLIANLTATLIVAIGLIIRIIGG